MDDLTRINGIGAATAKRLAAEGIDTFEKLLHAGPAGEHGIKVEWIVEATDLLHESQGKPPRPDDGAEDRSPEGADLPEDGGAGDPHANTPPSDDRGGGDGDTAVPAREDAPGDQDPSEGDQGGGGVPDEGASAVPAGANAEFRASFPRLTAALDAYLEQHDGTGAPTVRIKSRREGFRRAGRAHSKAPAEYAIDQFSPEDLERLLAEPVLTVELIG